MEAKIKALMKIILTHKIEQVAFACADPSAIINIAQSFGLKNWSHDTVVAKGHVFGLPATNKAELHFNYELGIELELIKYLEGFNWHRRRHPQYIFLSHMGFHVDEAKMQKCKSQLAAAAVEIAQEVITQSHTNPVIAGKRTYHYVVFDTQHLIGFDLKLIERIL